MKYLIHDWGLLHFKAKVEEYLGGRALADPHPVDIHGYDDHLGWRPQGDGKFYFGVNVENGRIKDDGSLRLKSGLRHRLERFRMTGCPNGCARPYTSDIGLVGKAVGKYTILVGGRILGNRLNVIYKDMVPLREVVKELVPLLVFFKAEREPGESLGDFCHRKGVEDLLRFDADWKGLTEPATAHARGGPGNGS